MFREKVADDIEGCLCDGENVIYCQAFFGKVVAMHYHELVAARIDSRQAVWKR